MYPTSLLSPCTCTEIRVQSGNSGFTFQPLTTVIYLYVLTSSRSPSASRTEVRGRGHTMHTNLARFRGAPRVPVPARATVLLVTDRIANAADSALSSPLWKYRMHVNPLFTKGNTTSDCGGMRQNCNRTCMNLHIITKRPAPSPNHGIAGMQLNTQAGRTRRERSRIHDSARSTHPTQR